MEVPMGIACVIVDSAEVYVHELQSKLAAPDNAYCQHVLLHFHGGLVHEDKGVEINQQLSAALGPHGIRVVSVIWRSSVQEILIDDIVKPVIDSRLFRRVRSLADRILGSIVGDRPKAKGAGSWVQGGPWPGPIQAQAVPSEAQLDALRSVIVDDSDWDDLSHDLDNPPTELQDRGEAIEIDDFDFERYRSKDGGDLYDEIERAAATKGVVAGAVTRAACNVARNVLDRLRKDQWHGFRATVTEEVLRELGVATVGRVAWKQIKNRGQALFEKNDSLGCLVLEQIRNAMTEDPDLTLDVVSHSAGSIPVCEMERAMHLGICPEVEIQNSFLLAPACRSTLYVETILVKEPNPRTRQILVTMRDDAEQVDWVLKPVYRGSLLYLVSGLFENETCAPILGLSRYFEGHRVTTQNLKRVFDTFAKTDPVAPGWLVLTPTDDIGHNTDGFVSLAASHGAFDQDESTLRSIAEIITERSVTHE